VHAHEKKEVAWHSGTKNKATFIIILLPCFSFFILRVVLHDAITFSRVFFACKRINTRTSPNPSASAHEEEDDTLGAHNL